MKTILRIAIALCVIRGVAGCRSAPAVSPLHFEATRGSLRVWAADSTSGALIGSVVGELRMGVRATFAPVQPMTDTLLFSRVPAGNYELVIRRIGYQRRVIAIRITPEVEDTLRVVMQLEPNRIYGEYWEQPPWWKFWRR